MRVPLFHIPTYKHLSNLKQPINFSEVFVALRAFTLARQPSNDRQLSTVDILALASMKNAAKCDT